MDRDEQQRIMQARSAARGLANALARMNRLDPDASIRITLTAVNGGEHIASVDVTTQWAEALADATNSVVDHAVCGTVEQDWDDDRDIDLEADAQESAEVTEWMANQIDVLPGFDADAVRANHPELAAQMDAVFASTETVGHWDRDVMELVNQPYVPGALSALAHVDDDQHMPDEDDTDGDL